jgi:hypothetical protein
MKCSKSSIVKPTGSSKPPSSISAPLHNASACVSTQNCRSQEEVAKVIRQQLGGDAAERVNKHGRTYIAITFPDPAGKKPAEQRLISRFKDTEDLIQAGEASIYVPLWGGPTMTTT